MKIAFFDAHNFERNAFDRLLPSYTHKIEYIEPRLNAQTANLAKGFDVVCSFVSDRLDAEALRILKSGGVKLIALRSAGFNHVDLKMAKELSMPIVRVPEYSPYAVAEHAVALLMTVNRKIHKAYARVRELNFSLDGLVGFDVHGKTVGLIGLGRIGTAAAKIFKGFGCEVLVYDKKPDLSQEQKIGIKFVELKTILKNSDVISLHVPLNQESKHILNQAAFNEMKQGAIVINTGRGGLIETKALIHALKTKKLGGAGLDVYEVEEGVFFNDLSATGIDDDLLARLITFPNVVITSHQAFLTHEALANIAEQTLQNVDAFEKGLLINEVKE
jgi:D-lactate dehydrogenase